MFNIDSRTMARLRPGLQRVIVFDPAPAVARLAGELLKDMGARHVFCSSDTQSGLELIAKVNPNLVCIETSAPGFDGVDLTLRMRRSSLAARTVPVIVMSAEATVEGIKAARDAGAHEFLRKPYTGRDLFRRVENVILNPRVWIQAVVYVGPDRRRFNSGAGSAARRAEDEPLGGPADGSPAFEASAAAAA